MTMNRRKKRGTDQNEMGGQDSFLDIVSNIVGILIILVMIAGVRAQNSPADSIQDTELEPTIQYAEKEQIETLEKEYETLLDKENQAIHARLEARSLKEESAIYDEQLALQSRHHAELFDTMTSVRAAIDMAAEEKSQETKEIIENQRQIQETEAKYNKLRTPKNGLPQTGPRRLYWKISPRRSAKR